MNFETPLAIVFAVAFAAVFNRKKIRAALAARSAKAADPAHQPEPREVDDAALTELISILARDRQPAIDAAVSAARAARAANDPYWWDATLESLVQSGAITGFDWKQFEGYERDALTDGLPFADAARQMPIAGGVPVEDKLKTLDAACRQFGYRLILPPVNDDSYRAVFIPEGRVADARVLSERLGVDAGL
jgi:hypothetical protein